VGGKWARGGQKSHETDRNDASRCPESREKWEKWRPFTHLCGISGSIAIEIGLWRFSDVLSTEHPSFEIRRDSGLSLPWATARDSPYAVGQGNHKGPPLRIIPPLAELLVPIPETMNHKPRLSPSLTIPPVCSTIPTFPEANVSARMSNGAAGTSLAPRLPRKAKPRRCSLNRCAPPGAASVCH